MNVRRAYRAVVAIAVVVAFGVSACAPPLTVEDQVADIVRFVEQNRGHAFVTSPTVTFVNDADFRADVLASVAAAEPEIDKDEVAFKALGWMNQGDSLFAKYQIAFGGAVVGFYDPVSKVLKVRGTELTPYRREVIAHELTHALDDQLFDLNEEKGPGLINQEQLAFLVAVEGSAARVQQAYVGTMNPIDQALDFAEQLSLGSDPALLTVPLALLSLAQTPYLQGPRFTAARAALGVPGLDSVFSNYPDTEEEAFDPAKYAADEGAAVVPTPPADGPVVRSGTWGQFLLTLILQNGLSLDATINPDTLGWAGGSFVTWRNGTDECIRIDTLMDSPQQAVVLGGSLSGWTANQLPNGTTSATVSTTGSSVRLTSCA